jgi:uncharacterized protein
MRFVFQSTVFALALCIMPVASPGEEAPPVCHGKDLRFVAGLSSAREKFADDLLNSDGLLWRIESPGVAPSYLYGTIHSTDDSAMAMARKAAKEINGASVVATELGGPMDAVEKANLGAAMLARALDHDRDTFEGLPAQDRAGVERLFVDQRYPADFIHHLKLWFLALLTATPACETRRQTLDLPEVDQFLAKTAVESGIKVIAIETPEEQLDAISAMRPDVAAALLAVAARDPGMSDDLYVTMIALYRQSRPAEILPIADVVGEMTEAERAAQDEFLNLLLVRRNAVMAERIDPLLKKGRAFVAVGALHLAGKDGLIDRIRTAGYIVSKVW